MDDLADRIASDPSVCSGKPCIRGTRIPIHIVLDLLAADESVENILKAYPGIERDDVRACIRHAAPEVPRRDVMDALVSSVVERIAEAIRPDKIVVFGSRARGEQGAESDIDLLIVHAGPESKRELKIKVRRLFPRQDFSMDILVLTPDEFESQKHIAGSAGRVAAREGILCHG